MRRVRRLPAIGLGTAGLALIATAAAVLLTPAGTWLLARAAESVAPRWGWQVAVGSVEGAPATGVSFSQLAAHNEAAGIHLQASLVTVDPWAYAVTVISPEVDVVRRPGPEETAADTAPPPRLPVARLPGLRVRDGRLRMLLLPDSVDVDFEGVSLAYQAKTGGDSADAPPRGELVAEAISWRLSRAGREEARGHLRGRVHLEPMRVELLELTVGAVSESWAADLSGGASVVLVPGLPLRVRATGTVEGDSTEAATFAAELVGDLTPPNLRLTAQGQGAHYAVGPLSLRALASVDGDQIRLGNLQVGVLGGEVAGTATYRPATDSLEAAVSWRNLHLEAVPGSGVAGILEGQVSAAGAPAQRRYAGSMSGRVRGVDALPGGPLDAEMTAAVDPYGVLTVQLSSPVGDIATRGTVDPSGAYDLALSGRLRPARLVGRAMGDVAVRGRLVPDTVKVDLRASDLPDEVRGLGPAHLKLQLTGGRLLDADLSLAGRAAALTAQVDVAETRLEAGTLQVRDLELARVDSQFAGQVSGSARANGSMRDRTLQGSASLQLRDLVVSGWQLGQAEVQLDLSPGALSASLAAPGLEATVEVDTALVLAARAALDDVAVVGPEGADGEAPATAVLSGVMRASGPLREPRLLTAELALSRLEAAQGPWQARASGPVVVSYQEGAGELRQARLETPLGQALVSGATRGDSIGLELRIDSLQWAPVHPQLTGRGGLALDVRGTVSDPVLVAELTSEGLLMAGRRLGVLSGRLSVSDSLLLAVDLRQDAGSGVRAETAVADSSLAVRLAVPLAPWRGRLGGGPARGRLMVEARQLRFGPLAKWALEDSVSGVIDASCRLEMPVPAGREQADWSLLTGQLTVRRAAVEKEGFRADLRDAVRADFEDGEVAVSPVIVPLLVYRRNLRALGPAGVVRAQGGTGGDRGQELTVQIDSVDLAAVERLPGVRDLSLPEGFLSARGSVRGPAGHRHFAATAQIHLDDLGDVGAQAAGGTEGAEAKVMWRTPADDSLGVALAVPAMPARGGLDWERGNLKLRSDSLDVAVFLELLPQLESLGGTVTADVDITGLGPRPQLAGQIGFRGLSFGLLDVQPVYQLPDGVMVFAGNRGDLQGFSGTAHHGRGRLDLTGYVELASLSDIRFQMDLAAEGLPYRYETIFEAPAVNANLSFAVANGESLVEGDVRLADALAEAPLVDLTAPPIPPPPAVQDPFLEAMRLNVFVDVRNLAVRNELTDLTMEGSSRIYGTFYKPRLQGEMQIVKGQVILLNRTFAFTKGTVVLDQLVPTYSILDLAYDPLLLNPELDLVATTTVKPIDADEEARQVTMSIQGPALRVLPRFTSEGLGEGEIISLLAFGSTTPANYQDALYTTAGQLVLSRGATRVGLDEFQLLPRGTVLSTADGSALRLGKHITSPIPMWVRYEALTRDPAIGQLRLEYDVTSYARVKATAQSEYQVYGLGIGFRREF